MKQTKAVLEAIEQARKQGLVDDGPAVRMEEVKVTFSELPLDVDEETFLQRVICYAQDRGWRVFHARPAQTAKGARTPVQGDGKGFPDLVLVRAGVVFVELKSTKGVLSQDQEDWRDALKSSLSTYRLWRPADWPDIVNFLK